MAGQINLTTANTSIPIFQQTGRAQLNQGVVTVFTPNAAVGMNVLLTPQDINTFGNVRVDNIQPGVSFDINSTGILDSGFVFWAILIDSLFSSIQAARVTLVNGLASVSSLSASNGMGVLLTAQDVNCIGTLELTNIVPGVSYSITSSSPTDNGVVLIATVAPTQFAGIAQQGRVLLNNGQATVYTGLVVPTSNILVSCLDTNTIGSVRITNIQPGISFDLNSTGINDIGLMNWVQAN